MRIRIVNINKRDLVSYNGKHPIECYGYCSLSDAIDNLKGLEATIATPGNSLGWMKGGFDRLLYDVFGDKCEIENRLIAPIPIGFAYVVKAGNNLSICYAPTMETPRSIVGTNNVFWAYLAVLRTCETDELITPLFGTGFGGISSKSSLRALEVAYEVYSGIRRVDSFADWLELEKEWYL